MLKPSKRHIEALRGLYNASPVFLADFFSYLKEAREHERQTFETCESQSNEVQKGKCQMLTEQLNTLKSLIPKLDDEKKDQF